MSRNTRPSRRGQPNPGHEQMKRDRRAALMQEIADLDADMADNSDPTDLVVPADWFDGQASEPTPPPPASDNDWFW